MSRNDDATRSRFAVSPWAVLAGLLVLIVVAVAVLLFVRDDGSDSAATPPSQSHTRATTAPATGSSTSSSTAATDSVCGLPSGDQNIPTTGVADQFVSNGGKLSYPVAPKTLGPGVTNADGSRTCFAHSPAGAVQAAATLLAMVNAVPRSAGVAQVKAMVIGGNVDSAVEQLVPAALSDGPSGTISAFKVTSYDSSSAVVSIGFSFENGGYAAIPLALQWKDGDWKAPVTDAGMPLQGGTQVLQSLDGFTSWSSIGGGN
ncbi:hypothetical protein ATK17_3923 [Branchiibius hedensis]|uniref:DUF8175 domain-containing protein n=1 Tax=Branchiibius hedensis TaxID=672460 RepID=A0A2Y9BMW8_9MICO|nr:hypothetical protein [Branchiibius hedensis]PWJ23032.1 hypothetical protein ATK17_3923 [Branchiibius hedensis]SSA59108.1 hypothetical protein SAMN04489750_3923 [Branchiibius hedensis]